MNEVGMKAVVKKKRPLLTKHHKRERMDFTLIHKDWTMRIGRRHFGQKRDNDPKHTCKKAKQWFQDHEYQVMDWPAQSPDINPIEHFGHHLKRILAEYEIPPKGILELWDRVEEEWNKIPSEVCQNPIESMPRHVEAVIKAKGGYTKY